MCVPLEELELDDVPGWWNVLLRARAWRRNPRILRVRRIATETSFLRTTPPEYPHPHAISPDTSYREVDNRSFQPCAIASSSSNNSATVGRSVAAG